MKTAYKIRASGTKSNNWLIAVIYSYEKWPSRNLVGKGLSNPQVIRESTEDEQSECEGHTRLLVYYYEDVNVFLMDEAIFNVPPEVTEQVISIFNRKQPWGRC